MKYKTGLNRMAKPPELRFGSYLMESQLPPIPGTFNRAYLFPPDGWGMLGNDQYGDCTVAGAMHAIMLWNKMAGHSARFTALDATDDYFAITGGDDTGADMAQVADYWQHTGMRDRHAVRHKIGAYLLGNPSNFDHLYAGCYILGPVGLGIEITRNSEAQFENEHEPWHIVDGDEVIGYHYVPLIDRVNGNAAVVTWGATQQIEQTWLAQHLKEVVFYVSPEDMVDGKSPQGFAMADLLMDLQVVGS